MSGILIGDMPLSSEVHGGVFTVNGKQITIASTDTLRDVFDRIQLATGGAVSAAYDPVTDKMTLTSGSEIVLGSATDTSNVLRAMGLSNNGTGLITSRSELGKIQSAEPLSSAYFATPIADGGAGLFKINGVQITYSSSTDSLQDVLDRINASAAGVTATYDAAADRVVLTSKSTGDQGIGLEDVTGDFLAGVGLLGGSLQRGSDLVYTINDGDQRTASTNTITEESSGLAGLSITVLDSGRTSITVESDTTTIKKAITDFIEQYNKVQGLIDTETSSSTDSDGKVTAGVLADDGDADAIALKLRNLANRTLGELTSVIRRLDDLGISSGGYDSNLTLSDETKLDTALANSLAAVREIFANSTSGIAVSIDAFLEQTIGEDGTLTRKQSALTKQTSDIDKQIAEMERYVESQRQRMIESFMAMEAAQARINQQLQFLSQKFGTSSQT